MYLVARDAPTIDLLRLVRIGIYILLTALAFYFCVPGGGFLLPSTLISLLGVIGLGTLIVAIVELNPPVVGGFTRLPMLHVVDILLIAAFLYFLGAAGTKLSFLFLIPLFMAGIILPATQTVRLGLLASIVLSASHLLLVEIDVDPVSFLVNQLSFLAVAGFTTVFKGQSAKLESSLRRADLEIESLKNLNDLIVGNISFGVLTTNMVGKIQFHNVIATSLLNDSQMVGKPLRFISHVMSDSIDKAKTARRHGGEIKTKAYDGSERSVVFTMTPMIDRSLGHLGYLFVLEDVTAVRQLEAQLRQREKLAAVGQLAAGIAHEIRNPLASISGSIQLLVTPGKSAEEDRLGRIVLREIDRLNNLITEFLDFAKPPQVGTDLVDLNSILKEITEVSKNNKELSAGVESVVSLAAKQLVIGDSDKYRQALLNIVINGYQAIGKSEVRRLTVKTFDDGGKVVVDVVDTGTGIAEEDLGRIFEPFHTTKVGGTGLGLAITHKIFEAHSVDVHVSSKLGQGTHFRMTFPAAPSGSESKKLRGTA